ncbi:MAG: hypothetical protein SNJ78_12895, partial [Spirochaetales bacterium]
MHQALGKFKTTASHIDKKGLKEYISLVEAETLFIHEYPRRIYDSARGGYASSEKWATLYGREL